MNLNILNRDIFSQEAQPVSELEFWMYYLTTINVAKQQLTAKEIEVLSHLVVNFPYEDNYLFSKEHRKELSEQSGIYKTNLPKILKSLEKKNLINISPANIEGNLLAFKQHIKKEKIKNINLQFKLQIEDE